MFQTEYASVDEWQARARELFGEDEWQWKFICPACGHVASILDWKNAGAKVTEVAFSCVGRHTENPLRVFSASVSMVERITRKGPCDYTGGGLFKLNPVKIVGRPYRVFQFAGQEAIH